MSTRAIVSYPKLGSLCWLVIPCALTALDHWSPEVKEQGMASFVHIANNVASAELSWYEEAILDACCRNIPASDELWYRVVEIVLRLDSKLQWVELDFGQFLLDQRVLEV
uniref:Uncharacterized protein n=1 Tax=Ananas comosus var. bracteatus TaxID=296719 RepID=A0A6V7PA40_ANACO|nr:unnamed protein product [Ananas comosus var. bracteatus]